MARGWWGGRRASWRALGLVLALVCSLGLASCSGVSGTGDGGTTIAAIQEQAERAATATVVAAKGAYVDGLTAAARAHQAGILSNDAYSKVLAAGWKVYPALLAADESLKAYFRLTTGARDPAALVAILVDLQIAYNAFRDATRAEGVIP